MSKTITGTYTTGFTLTDPGSNPLTIAATGVVSNAAGPGVYGGTTAVWTVTNAGLVQATASTSQGIGVDLAGGGTVTNTGTGQISAYYVGVFLQQTGTVDNQATIAATGNHGGGIRSPGGLITNEATGTISANYIGALMSGAGTFDNAGTILANVYGVGFTATGVTVTNEAGGTISASNVGVVLTVAGTVTNSGSISSNNPYVASAGDYAAVDLRAGGLFVNAAGATVNSQFKGVAIGTTSGDIGGTVVNQGTILANNGTGSVGAAVWIHGPASITNDVGAVMGNGPYGIVGYDNMTIVNRGTIVGNAYNTFPGYAVFQANTAAADLVQMAPGAVFTGLVEGGANTAGAALGTLELLAGANAGSLTGFGTQFIQFSNVLLDNGARWSLAGTVSSSQTVAFAGAAGTLTLVNPLAMAGTLDGFGGADDLVLSGITGVTSALVNASNMLIVSAGGSVVFSAQLGTNSTVAANSQIAFSQAGGATSLVACFAEGTRIATEAGEVAVEALAAGMRVRSAFGGLAEIAWVGHRRTDCRAHPRPHDVWPVRVSAGAFGEGMPGRTLWLSPDHAVHVDGVLVPVRYLLNGATIAQEPRAAVTYYHVELPSHDVILAEGLACESYLDTGNRGAFANGGGAVQLHPDFALRIWEARACAPLVTCGPRLAAIRAGLLARAEAAGPGLSLDAELAVLGGVATVADGVWRVTCPPGVVRLVSRVFVPGHVFADSADMRVLGVAVADLAIDGVALALDDARLGAGWQAAEAGLRWTTGDAAIDMGRGGELRFRVAVTGRYWDADGARRAG